MQLLGLVNIRQDIANVMLKELLAPKSFMERPLADVFDSDHSSLPLFWTKLELKRCTLAYQLPLFNILQF